MLDWPSQALSCWWEGNFPVSVYFAWSESDFICPSGSFAYSIGKPYGSVSKGIRMYRRTFLQRSAAFAGMGALASMTEPSPAAPTFAEFQDHQRKRRKELWGLLGDLPHRTAPKARLVKSEGHPGY